MRNFVRFATDHGSCYVTCTFTGLVSTAHLMLKSGVGSYEELDIRLGKAKERVVRSTGAEAFRDMLARLPLTPTDETVEAIALEVGWQEEFMTVSRATLPIATSRLRPVVGNREVPRMFAAQRAVAETASVPSPARGFGNGPLPPVPPPRPFRRVPQRNAAPAAAPETVSKAAPATPAATAAPAPGLEVHPVDAAGGIVAGGSGERGEHGLLANAATSGEAAEDTPVCAVCQDDIRPGSAEVSVFDCGHVFHQICIARWRRVANTEVLRCPRCRHVTEQQDDWVIPQDVEDDEPEGLQEVNAPAAAGGSGGNVGSRAEETEAAIL